MHCTGLYSYSFVVALRTPSCLQHIVLRFLLLVCQRRQLRPTHLEYYVAFDRMTRVGQQLDYIIMT